MNKFVALILGSVLLMSTQAMAEEQIYPSPQEGAPNIYKKLFENEKVVVNEITFNPGDKAAMHKHAYPHVVYVIEGGTLQITKADGAANTVTVKPGDVVWFEAETHEAVNVGTTVLRGTVTEIK